MLLLLVCVVPEAAWAQASWLAPAQTVGFSPRAVHIARPVRVYLAPGTTVREAGLDRVSFVDVRDRFDTFLAQDPRYRMIDAGGASALLDGPRDSAESDLALIARQSARLGMASYRQYQMATAIDELRGALQSWARTLVPLSEPAEVSEALLYQALAAMQLARDQAEDSSRYSALARAALRELVRIDPGRVLSPDDYPSGVVQQWETAWAEHLYAGADGLGLSVDEVRLLGQRLDVDTVIEAFLVVEADTLHAHLRVWDVVGARRLLDERMVATADAAQLGDALVQALSRHVACATLLPPPRVVEVDPEQNAVYTSIGGQAAWFGNSPVEQFHVHMGPGFRANWMLRSGLGLSVTNGVLFSLPESSGDLVDRIDSVQVGLNLVTAARWRRARLYVGSGPDFMRRGSIDATRSFWCKVSDGEPVVFDETRDCDADDVVRSAPAVQFGVGVEAGAEVLLGGPVWLGLHLASSVYVFPFGRRALDFPTRLGLGFTYRL